MAYTRPIRFEPGTFLRQCDICGWRFRANELVRGTDQKFRCIRWCAEQTQLDRDLISAAANKRREAPPPPFGIPFSFKDAYGVESALFNALTVVKNVFTPVYYSENARYLYGIIAENKRPVSWISAAKTKFRNLADAILSIQTKTGSTQLLGSIRCDTNFGSTSLSLTGAAFESSTQASMGLVMLYAYLTFGDVRYLTGARLMADFVTNLQSGGLCATVPSTSDSGGANPTSYGCWTRAANSSLLFDHVYRPDSLLCLEFLNLLFKTVGDELHGDTTTGSGFWTSPPSQLLSVSISKGRAFWSVGAADNVTNSTITGLSATTPRLQFNAYPASGKFSATGLGAWEFSDGTPSTGTIINTSLAYNQSSQAATAAAIPIALRALYNFEGYSAQVQSVWTWLMGFSSNPAFQSTTSSRALDAPTSVGTLGTYNPKLSLATVLTVRSGGAAVALNGSSTYAWETGGIMSAIQGAKSPIDLDNFKDYVTKGVTAPTDYDYGTNGNTYIMLLGRSGLGGQITSNSPILLDCGACIGQAFRNGTTSYPFQA